MKAACYIRVSTDRQASEGESLEMQFARAKELCAQKGWTLTEVYQDVMTGKNDKRPALQRFEADLKAGLFKVVICYKIDRLGRSRKKLHELLEWIHQHEAHLVSMTQPIDTSTAIGRMMLGFMVEIAVFETEQLGERVSDTLFNMAKQGRPVSGSAPYGYRYQRKQVVVDEAGSETTIPGKLYVHPEEAEGVRLAFDTYLKKGSLASAMKILNEAGFRTKNGKPWDVTAIKALLLNPLYGGERAVRRFPKVGGKQRGRSKAYGEMKDWLIVPADHEAIASPEVTKMAREQFLAAKETPARTRSARNAWSGLVVCGLCGYRLYAYDAGNGRGRYFRCRHSQGRACECRQAPLMWLETDVLAAIIRAVDSSTLIREFTEKGKKAGPREVITAKPDQAKAIQNKLKQIERLDIKFDNGLLDKDTYTNELKRLKREIDSLQAEAPKPKRYTAVRLPSSLQHTWASLSGDEHLAERKALLGLLVHTVTIDNDRAEVTLHAFEGVEDLPRVLTVDRWNGAKPLYLRNRWSKDRDACVRCGSSKEPHFAKGKCRTCYEKAKHKRRRLDPQGRTNSIGRWSKTAEACAGCGTTEVAHCARGLCFRCYDKARRKIKMSVKL